MRIHQLIEELRNIEPVASHKSALDIGRMLSGNRTIFLKHIDGEVYKQLLKQFEELSSGRPGFYQSAGFKREYEAAYNLLMFYLGKVI